MFFKKFSRRFSRKFSRRSSSEHTPHGSQFQQCKLGKLAVQAGKTVFPPPRSVPCRTWVVRARRPLLLVHFRCLRHVVSVEIGESSEWEVQRCGLLGCRRLPVAFSDPDPFVPDSDHVAS